MFGDSDIAKALIPEFDRLYAAAERILKKYNPCNVCDGVCARGRADSSRNFCCGPPNPCKYLGPSGCTVQCLQCRTSYCDDKLIPEDYRADFKREMWTVFIESSRLNLLVTRGSMEDSIQHACDVHFGKKAPIIYRREVVPEIPPSAVSTTMEDVVASFRTSKPTAAPTPRIKLSASYALPKFKIAEEAPREEKKEV